MKNCSNDVNIFLFTASSVESATRNKEEVIQKESPKAAQLLSDKSDFAMEKEQNQLGDDMKPREWLEEIGMGQYTETFAVNFCHGGSYLSRKRLAAVRLQDLANMNIQIFEDQKIILGHIRHSLKYSFNNPVRKDEVKRLKSLRTSDGGYALEDSNRENEDIEEA